ncbi:hypothetical protein NL529_29830, partial [Klebsiella pneumoniae]|nr:hypothetical protein [Klebsiella pneumoniae]
GLLELNGGTFSATAGITNNAGGEIHLMSTSSTLAGGTISNSGLLTGTGRSLAALSNQSGGEVRVNANDDLRFLGAANSNAGRINLFNG